MNNLDHWQLFWDWAGNKYQWYMVLFLDLILRKGFKEINFNKLEFEAIKKYWRPEIKKRIRQIKLICRHLMKDNKKTDIYLWWHRECFEDINVLSQLNNNIHIFAQIKGTSLDKDTIPWYKKIIYNFFKNTNYNWENWLFFILCNYKVNENIKSYLRLVRKGEYNNSIIELIEYILLDKEKKEYDKLSIYILSKVIKEEKLLNKEQIYIEKKFEKNLLTITNQIFKVINILRNIVIIEHISFKEILTILETHYKEDLPKYFTIAMNLSSEKTIKNRCDDSFQKYLYYNNTYFYPKIPISRLENIEDWGFFNIS